MLMRKPEGFTLVEVLISMFVGIVIIGAIYAAVVSSQRSTVNIERKVVAGQDARAALELMALEIQMASYNPTFATDMWIDPTGDCTASGNQNYRGIQTATAKSISVEADIDEKDGVIKIAGKNPNEIITYTYDSDNQYITRETGCGGAQAFLGETVASGRPRTVHVINTTAVPVFRYYDVAGNPIDPGAVPAAIPRIARIEITLWVETEDKDANSGQPRRQMIYSTNVIPRNHVIN
jgi:type II secretory pathway pseudopilin PulG